MFFLNVSLKKNNAMSLKHSKLSNANDFNFINLFEKCLINCFNSIISHKLDRVYN